MSVDNVSDIGNGEPLFSNFAFEDWALMSLRFEFYLLVKSFKHDVNDDERPGMLETHFPFYYNKYYKKQVNMRGFGATTVSELASLVKDVVTIDKRGIVVSELAADKEIGVDTFVKLTEESRRERQRRIDAGDETAKLKLSLLASTQATPATGQTVSPRVIAPTNMAKAPQ